MVSSSVLYEATSRTRRDISSDEPRYHDTRGGEEFYGGRGPTNRCGVPWPVVVPLSGAIFPACQNPSYHVPLSRRPAHPQSAPRSIIQKNPSRSGRAYHESSRVGEGSWSRALARQARSALIACLSAVVPTPQSPCGRAKPAARTRAARWGHRLAGARERLATSAAAEEAGKKIPCLFHGEHDRQGSLVSPSHAARVSIRMLPVPIACCPPPSCASLCPHRMSLVSPSHRMPLASCVPMAGLSSPSHAPVSPSHVGPRIACAAGGTRVWPRPRQSALSGRRPSFRIGTGGECIRGNPVTPCALVTFTQSATVTRASSPSGHLVTGSCCCPWPWLASWHARHGMAWHGRPGTQARTHAHAHTHTPPGALLRESSPGGAVKVATG